MVLRSCPVSLLMASGQGGVLGVWCLAGSEQTGGVSDHYADGTYRWRHLSVPSPELHQALTDGWLPPPGLALDAGCGLGAEAGYLHRLGWRVIGVDLSPVALAGAIRRNHGPSYVRADLLQLAHMGLGLLDPGLQSLDTGLALGRLFAGLLPGSLQSCRFLLGALHLIPA